MDAKTIAIKLNAETIRFIFIHMTKTQTAEFSYALLTSAYNGENWYYVKNPHKLLMPGILPYYKMIMTEDKLREHYDIDENANVNAPEWFEVFEK